jgi:hypothetical protein
MARKDATSPRPKAGARPTHVSRPKATNANGNLSRTIESPNERRRRLRATKRPNTWLGVPIGEVPLTRYARLSEVLERNDTDNVDMQDRHTAVLGERERLNVVGDCLKDNDRSASWFGAQHCERESYNELIAALVGGTVGGVIVTRWDRLCRNDNDLAELIDLGNRHGSLWVFYWDIGRPDGGNVERLNLGTSTGQDTARRLTQASARESKQMSERMTGRKNDKRRERGVSGVGCSAFGWLGKRHSTAKRPVLKSDGMTPHPREAKEIRNAVKHYLDDGWTLTMVTEDWNARRVPTPRGAKSWDVSRVRDILANERHAGLIDVEVEPGKWELHKAAWHANAIISEHDYRRVKAKMNANKGNAPGPKRMLTSLVRCTECTCIMRAHMSGKNVQWRCLRQPGRDACGGIGCVVPNAYVEHYVTEWLFDILHGKKMKGAQRARQTKARDIDLTREDVQRRYDSQMLGERMSDEAMAIARRQYDEAMAQLEAQAHNVDRASEQARYIAEGDRIIAEWNAGQWDDAEKRALAQAFIEAVWVSPRQGKVNRGPVLEPEDEAVARCEIIRRKPIG